MVYSEPRQNFGSTSPLFSRYTSFSESVYPKNNGEVVPKLRLGQERNMEPNLIYAFSGCPKNVDNPKQIPSQICSDPHTSNHICFERETPNWGTRSIYGNDTRESMCIPRVAKESG